ncbi:unnamed protein product, partial [marine sediment metagenome]
TEFLRNYHYIKCVERQIAHTSSLRKKYAEEGDDFLEKRYKDREEYLIKELNKHKDMKK